MTSAALPVPPGDPAYRRITVALFLAGLATFALLYCTQPLLPELAEQFQITPGESTLAVSLTTVALGASLLVAGTLSEVVGRTRLMHASLIISSLVGLLCALAWSWPMLLVLRTVMGLTLAGLPAVAVAYLREEIAASAQGRAVGLYIGGTALGGMCGRLIVGAVADLAGWHAAIAAIGLTGLACAVAVRMLLPPSRFFVPRQRSWAMVWTMTRMSLSDKGLVALYVIGGTLMGSFVATYNAMGFRLKAPPYLLSLGVAGLVFLTYSLGSVSSAYAGRLADRLGSRAVVPASIGVAIAGLLVTLAEPLWMVFVGLGLVTVGFFAAHGVASSWVAARASFAGAGASQAASLYLFSYYVGSSLFGGLSGSAWSAGGWPRVVLLAGAILTVGLVLALWLRWVPSLRDRAPKPEDDQGMSAY